MNSTSYNILRALSGVTLLSSYVIVSFWPLERTVWLPTAATSGFFLFAYQPFYRYQFGKYDYRSIFAYVVASVFVAIITGEYSLLLSLVVGTFGGVILFFPLAVIFKKSRDVTDEVLKTGRIRNFLSFALWSNPSEFKQLIREASPDRRRAYRIAFLFTVVPAILMGALGLLGWYKYSDVQDFPFGLFFYQTLLLLFVIDGARAMTRLATGEALERKSVQAELQAAREMQLGLLPRSNPEIPGFEISGASIPANEVGGDFFDYLWLDERKTRLGIAVADVSGKAMKAAITAVMTSGMIYREMEGNGSPKQILRKINKPMFAKIDQRMFTALSFAVLDIRKKTLRFSNAGQVYPLLKRRGKVTPLEVQGVRLPLGVKEDVRYHELSLTLKPGDLLIFYTDGIIEGMNNGEEMYGNERFRAFVENLPDRSAEEIKTSILDDVRLFTGDATQHDDMTVVVVSVGRTTRKKRGRQ